VELAKFDPDTLQEAQRAAVEPLRAMEAREMGASELGLSPSLTVGADPTELRSFENTPREGGEATLSADWLGEQFAIKLSATVVTNPADDQSVRPDGRCVAVSLGNRMLPGGYLGAGGAQSRVAA